MDSDQLFIGALAKRAGVNTTTIRYYETIGLLPHTQRGENRYRLYSKETVELLQFIAKAKRLGFTLSEIKEIVEIRHEGHAPCIHVKALLESKITDLDQQIAGLLTLRKMLGRLSSNWKRQARRKGSMATICPHIEQAKASTRHVRTVPEIAFS
jgi:DNA-binding transcriptional MerR regulator